jgi:hypothetical protein
MNRFKSYFVQLSFNEADTIKSNSILIHFDTNGWLDARLNEERINKWFEHRMRRSNE